MKANLQVGSQVLFEGQLTKVSAISNEVVSLQDGAELRYPLVLQNGDIFCLFPHDSSEAVAKDAISQSFSNSFKISLANIECGSKTPLEVIQKMAKSKGIFDVLANESVNSRQFYNTACKAWLKPGDIFFMNFGPGERYPVIVKNLNYPIAEAHYVYESADPESWDTYSAGVLQILGPVYRADDFTDLDALLGSLKSYCLKANRGCFSNMDVVKSVCQTLRTNFDKEVL